MTPRTPETIEQFTDLVTGLRAAGWTPLPIGPPFAEFLAVRFPEDNIQDSLIIYDIDHVDAHREQADGKGWSFAGHVRAVQRALTRVGGWVQG